MKTKVIKAKVQEYFLLNPTVKLRVRQVEREVNVPLPSAIRYTKELEKEGVLKGQEIAEVKLYSANRDSPQYLLEKRLFNIRQLYAAGLVQHFVEKYDNPTIIVFGSYSRGEDIETSDIDLYLETPHKEIKDLEGFEKKLQRKIQVFCHKSIKEIKNKELANNIINGVTLRGFVEAF